MARQLTVQLHLTTQAAGSPKFRPVIPAIIGEQTEDVIPFPLAHGLSEQLIEAANFMVRIPMRGNCDSMNAAVAAGVLLFKMASQRPGG